MPWPYEQNYLLFRTETGTIKIPAGETVRVTAKYDYGVPVANYKTIRVYASCRFDAAEPVTFSLGVVQVEAGELIFILDNFTVQPGTTTTKTYDVPGRSIVAFATAGAGTGSAGIDFGILGFGPRAWDGTPCGQD